MIVNYLSSEKETFKEAIDLFVTDCDLRNLRSYTVRYYQNELQAFLKAIRRTRYTCERVKVV